MCVGINKGEEYLESENLFTDYPSCIFVCLDEEKVVMEKGNKPEIPYFDNLEKSLLPHYVKLNSNLNYKIFDDKAKGKKEKRGNLKFVGTSEENEKCIKIIELFKSSIEEKIIKHIPTHPIHAGDHVNKYYYLFKVAIEQPGL